MIQQRFAFMWIFLFGFSSINALANSTNVTSTEPFVNQNSTKKMAKYSIKGKSSSIQYMSEMGSHCIDDGFFPDRDDCRKFHVCYNGKQSIRWCKDGMLWDSKKIACSPQNITSCTGGRKKWAEHEDANPKSMKGNYTCRSGSTGLFADPSSCSVYHWCILGVLQSTHHCNLGLHFSASASGCILPKDAECEGQIAPPYSPIDCALGSSGYFPDPYDCSVFHYCNGMKNHSESLLCTAGRLWSSRHENCVLPDEVPECQNTCPTNYSSQMRFADPIICSRYIQCVDGHLEQRTCPTNFLFDRITKTCKPYDQAECHGNKPDLSFPSFFTSSTMSSTTTSTPSYFYENNNHIQAEVIKKQRNNQFTCLVDGYYGDPHDCRLYHVCVDGRDYRSMCAPGLAWESLLRLCLPNHLVHCPNSKNFDMTPSGSKSKWFDTFTRAVIKTTTTKPSIFTCVGRVNGYYPDPIHCNKFHYCATGWQSMMECDEGLAYSSREHDCVPVELSDCTNDGSEKK